MKKISRIIIPALLLLSFIAPACGEFEEIDLPEKIVLPKEGGKLYIYSKSGIMVFLSTMQESLLPTDATTTATGNRR